MGAGILISDDLLAAALPAVAVDEHFEAALAAPKFELTGAAGGNVLKGAKGAAGLWPTGNTLQL